MPRPEGGLRVAVAGGSLGGLCAASQLRRIGADVTVYERAAGEMRSRGAGIVVQPDLTRLLEAVGAPSLPTTGCTHRRHLQPDDGEGQITPAPQRFTSWGAIYRTLRATWPDERYRQGVTIDGFDLHDDRVVPRLDGAEPVDLLIAADGSRSSIRGKVLPGLESSYAGYVAWRGTIEEAEAPATLVAYFDGRFSFSAARRGGHALCYLIPGAEAAVEPGRRRLNWVWYEHVPAGEALERLLTDRNGTRHRASIPPGLLPDAVAAGLRRRAEDGLHPRFAGLIAATPQPFLQTILDLAVPRMAFGRVCLMGDAAFVVRPHTAAATAKAAADASALAAVLERWTGSLEPALRLWEEDRLQAGAGLVAYGKGLGSDWVRRRA